MPQICVFRQTSKLSVKTEGYHEKIPKLKTSDLLNLRIDRSTKAMIPSHESVMQPVKGDSASHLFS